MASHIDSQARHIPGVSEKMLGQQLRHLERDGLITRMVHAEVPPKVEYVLTPWGLSLCPALDGLLEWVERHCGVRPSNVGAATRSVSLDTGSQHLIDDDHLPRSDRAASPSRLTLGVLGCRHSSPLL